MRQLRRLLSVLVMAVTIVGGVGDGICTGKCIRGRK